MYICCVGNNVCFFNLVLNNEIVSACLLWRVRRARLLCVQVLFGADDGWVGFGVWSIWLVALVADERVCGVRRATLKRTHIPSMSSSCRFQKQPAIARSHTSVVGRAATNELDALGFGRWFFKRTGWIG